MKSCNSTVLSLDRPCSNNYICFTAEAPNRDPDLEHPARTFLQLTPQTLSSNVENPLQSTSRLDPATLLWRRHPCFGGGGRLRRLLEGLTGLSFMALFSICNQRFWSYVSRHSMLQVHPQNEQGFEMRSASRVECIGAAKDASPIC